MTRTGWAMINIPCFFCLAVAAAMALLDLPYWGGFLIAGLIVHHDWVDAWQPQQHDDDDDDDGWYEDDDEQPDPAPHAAAVDAHETAAKEHQDRAAKYYRSN